MNIIKEKILQGVHPIPVHIDHGPAMAQNGSEGITLEFIVGFLRRRAMTILFSALFMTILSVTYFIKMPATYTAVAQLEIDTRRFQLFQHPENLGEKVIDTSWAVESQLELLKSEKIALMVIKKLHLADDPEFGSARATISQIPVIGRLVAKQPNSESARERGAISVIEKSLNIRRLGGSLIIEVSFQSSHPERAAQVANAIAEAYIEDQLDSRYEATRQGSKYLAGRLSELRAQIASAQKAIIVYKAQNNLVEDTRGRLITEQQLTDLNNQMAAARAKKTELQAQIDRIAKILGKEPSADGVVNVGGDIIKNNVLMDKLRTQYIDAASREKEWSEKYGSNNLVVVNLRNSIRAIRGAIRDELKRVEDSLRSDYDAASELEKSLQGQLEKAVVESQSSDKSQVTLRQLESSAQEYKKLYDNFLTRHSEAVEQQSFLYTEARLISKATPPLHATYRKRLLIVALLPFAGVFIGVGIGALREFIDKGIRTSSQVEKVLGLNCLALIPMRDNELIKTSWLKYLNAMESANAFSKSGEYLKKVNVLDDQSLSQFAESIRSVKLAIDLTETIPTKKVIGLTSSIPNEGKTTLAAELALGIARSGAHVVLVDCDFRNPSLSRAIAPLSTCGILDVLSNKKSLTETMWRHESTGLAFLPANVNSRVANSCEILASSAIRNLFGELSQGFDYVIVDLPPIAPIVDVRATGHFIDGYLFVIEWGKTSGAVAEHALSAVAPFRDKILGAVLNKVDIMQLSLYDGARAAYYHNKYYARYGGPS